MITTIYVIIKPLNAYLKEGSIKIAPTVPIRLKTKIIKSRYSENQKTGE